jgi:hypothetical protein
VQFFLVYVSPRFGEERSVSGEIAQTLHDLAFAIEKTYPRLAPAEDLPNVSPADGQAIHADSMSRGGTDLAAEEHVGARAPALHSDLVAITQDLRETANAALQCTPTLFWIEGLFSRIRALGIEELAGLVARAEREIDRHYT